MSDLSMDALERLGACGAEERVLEAQEELGWRVMRERHPLREWARLSSTTTCDLAWVMWMLRPKRAGLCLSALLKRAAACDPLLGWEDGEDVVVERIAERERQGLHVYRDWVMGVGVWLRRSGERGYVFGSAGGTKLDADSYRLESDGWRHANRCWENGCISDEERIVRACVCGLASKLSRMCSLWGREEQANMASNAIGWLASNEIGWFADDHALMRVCGERGFDPREILLSVWEAKEGV